MNNHFIWPKTKLRLLNFYGFHSVKKIEKKLRKMFPSAYPVVCSSGRVALYIALKQSNLTRNNNLNVFPFASHCVLNIIGQVTSPGFRRNGKNDYEIIYHQWGYTHKSITKNLIEDSVDSLYIPGSKLLSQGGRFEIWSFNKILGSTSGGVLWCKNKKDAEDIKKFIKYSPFLLFQWLLRILSQKFEVLYKYWDCAENGYLGITIFQSNEIWNQLKKWDKLVEDRKIKISLLKKYSLIKDLNIENRLPCIINLSPELYSINDNSKIGIRHFDENRNSESRKLIKVNPIPIHQDVTLIELNKYLEFFK